MSEKKAKAERKKEPFAYILIEAFEQDDGGFTLNIENPQNFLLCIEMLNQAEAYFLKNLSRLMALEVKQRERKIIVPPTIIPKAPNFLPGGVK